MKLRICHRDGICQCLVSGSVWYIHRYSSICLPRWHVPSSLYSENARLFANWQWNARDCVTGLHDRRSRECNPVTPVEYVSLSFRTYPCVLVFITYTLCTNGIEMVLSNEFNTKKLTRSYIFFKFAICSIALLSLGETCHLKGWDMVTVWLAVLLLSCYDCDIIYQHYDVTRFECVLWRRTIMIGLWIFISKTWFAQAIHKHDPHPLETMGHVW